MDPNVTYKMMMEYFMEDDLDEAIRCAIDLRDWVDKGGFKPFPVKGFDFDRALASVLAFHTPE